MPTAALLRDLLPLPRVLVRLRGGEPGPMLLVVAGIHGNEPAGVLACLELLGRLAADGVGLRGDVVALSGNRPALAVGRRFIDRDLNRNWSAAAVARLMAEGADAGPAEDREQRDLIGAIDRAVAEARGPLHFLDLHTTSADGVPFALADDAASAHRFALAFHLPVLVGLLGAIGNTLLTHMAERGALVAGVEGGQNDSPRSVAHHQAVLELALAAAGLVDPAELPGFDRARDRLEAARGDLPRLLEVGYRHGIQPEDDFRMEPGFANLHPVGAGTLLAHDRHGDIRAPEDGYVVMPLYQAAGEDGFFFGQARD